MVSGSNMSIIEALDAFDGKHTDVLEGLVRRKKPDTSLIRDLCALAEVDDVRLQTASTWMLKRYQDDGLSFSPEQIENLLGLIEKDVSWQPKLHILQMMPLFCIPDHRKDRLHAHLIDHLYDENKFVRAWAYNGLAVLAEQYPSYRDEVAGHLKRGQAKEAASVRARIRNVCKDLPWIQAD